MPVPAGPSAGGGWRARARKGLDLGPVLGGQALGAAGVSWEGAGAAAGAATGLAAGAAAVAPSTGAGADAPSPLLPRLLAPDLRPIATTRATRRPDAGVARREAGARVAPKSVVRAAETLRSWRVRVLLDEARSAPGAACRPPLIRHAWRAARAEDDIARSSLSVKHCRRAARYSLPRSRSRELARLSLAHRPRARAARVARAAFGLSDGFSPVAMPRLKVACVQVDPTHGDPAGNMRAADAILARLSPTTRSTSSSSRRWRTADTVSTTTRTSAESSRRTTAPTVRWCAAHARRLRCTLLCGYPRIVVRVRRRGVRARNRVQRPRRRASRRRRPRQLPQNLPVHHR